MLNNTQFVLIWYIIIKYLLSLQRSYYEQTLAFVIGL